MLGARTSSRVALSGAVVSLSSGVMTSASGMSPALRKSVSRFVTMPTSLPPIRPFSVIGMPEKPYFCLMASTSSTVCSGESTFGLVMKPFLKFFTRSTCLRCSWIVLL